MVHTVRAAGGQAAMLSWPIVFEFESSISWSAK